MKKLFCIENFFMIVAFIVSINVQAKSETYIREYKYQASETDSKLTARMAAMEQVKQLLLGELGTYVKSRIDMVKTSDGRGISQQKINTITAGIIKTEILKESWNGVHYYVKARLVADPDDIAKKLQDKRYIASYERISSDEINMEKEYWETIRSKNNVKLYKSYLNKYPDGKYKELALLSMKHLNDAEASIRLEKERAREEKRLLLAAIGSNNNNNNQQQSGQYLIRKSGIIKVYARHDTGGRSDSDRDVVTTLLADTIKKQLRKFVPRGSRVDIISDFDKTEPFLAEDYNGIVSKKYCSKGKVEQVISTILEDHEGKGGRLREMRFGIFDCEESIMRTSSFIPEFKKGGRFSREYSIRNEFRRFVSDFIDAR